MAPPHTCASSTTAEDHHPEGTGNNLNQVIEVQNEDCEDLGPGEITHQLRETREGKKSTNNKHSTKENRSHLRTPDSSDNISPDEQIWVMEWEIVEYKQMNKLIELKATLEQEKHIHHGELTKELFNPSPHLSLMKSQQAPVCKHTPSQLHLKLPTLDL